MKTAGIEPATYGFGIRHSTAELSLLCYTNQNGVISQSQEKKQKVLEQKSAQSGNRTRVSSMATRNSATRPTALLIMVSDHC